MNLDLDFVSPFLDRRGSKVESEGDLDGLLCILLNWLGFGARAQFSEVMWRGTLVLSGSNATPVVSERETSYWSGGVNSACRNLSPASFKRLNSVMLETSFSRVLGPFFVSPPKPSVLLSWRLSGAIIQILPRQDRKDIKRFRDNQFMDFTVFLQYEVFQCYSL